jgi:hypothetical protein
MAYFPEAHSNILSFTSNAQLLIKLYMGGTHIMEYLHRDPFLVSCHHRKKMKLLKGISLFSQDAEQKQQQILLYVFKYRAIKPVWI